MNSETILQSDVLDIVFEKRNKLYGAYTLRKFYNNRLFKSMGITLGVVTFLCAFTLIPEKKHVLIDFNETVLINIQDPMTKVIPPKELPKPKKVIIPQKIFVPPTIVADNQKTDSVTELKPHEMISGQTLAGTDNAYAIIQPAGLAGGGEPSAPLTPVVDKTIPTDHPDVQPAYPGGMDALRRFLEHNLVNPTEMEEGQIVAVNIKFVVGYDGKLQQFAVVKDGGNIFNNEVIRVLKKMPAWIPGKTSGQNVAVNFVIPIKFVAAE